VKYLLKSVNIPLGRIEQNIDSQGKLTNSRTMSMYKDLRHPFGEWDRKTHALWK